MHATDIVWLVFRKRLNRGFVKQHVVIFKLIDKNPTLQQFVFALITIYKHMSIESIVIMYVMYEKVSDV